jgi:hypothetical protein
MKEFVGFAGVSGAIVVSIGLALALEWLGLRGLMHLMPASAPAPSAGGDGLNQSPLRSPASRATKL